VQITSQHPITENAPFGHRKKTFLFCELSPAIRPDCGWRRNMGWSEATVISCNITISTLWGNTAYCMREVQWWTSVALVERNWISWFKKTSALSLSY